MASMGYLLALHRPLNGVRVVLEKSSYAGTKRRTTALEKLYICETIRRHTHTRSSHSSYSLENPKRKASPSRMPGSQGVTERCLLPPDDLHRHADRLFLLCRQVQARPLQQALALGEHLSLSSRHRWRRACNKPAQRGRGLLG
eukprot:scaffold126970_cov63-Phaeocystis_antarctica.AAC.8